MFGKHAHSICGTVTRGTQVETLLGLILALIRASNLAEPRFEERYEFQRSGGAVPQLIRGFPVWVRR